MSRVVRILSTHDFFGSFATIPTSYGSLAGGEGLRSAARTLKTRAALWIDSGDLTQGGPLTVATQGRGGLAAAGELGIDVSVVGNHDLDFGAAFLQAHVADLRCPMLCSNVAIGLPQTAMLPTSAGTVGVIGLTHHNLHAMRFWTVADTSRMPTPDDQLDVDVPAIAGELRHQGADVVVALVHDGVDWSFRANGRYIVDEVMFADRCRSWRGAIDLIIAGHTLGRFFGEIEGTPVMQPWPLGAEIAVIDLDLATGRALAPPRGVLVEARGQWRGTGADIIAEAAADHLGDLDRPLYARSGGPMPLADFLAAAIADVTDADVTFAYATCGQPTLDGIFAYLENGPVSRLQLLQLVPYTTFDVVVTEVDPIELETIRALVRPRPQSRTTAWGQHVRQANHRCEILRLATTRGAAQRVISDMIGRELRWQPSGRTLFDGVRSILA
ncbi:2',3'-cyclic-nucleotide 2'-phosphodiesterase (5'-nucleotidase family) [Chelatococcus asaccharovorans]|nr:2',3'-cyclic-nucleotide 2'-phosphodiesterase (5'-nucleotidase family) [Chelatococcus asaccharovorans]CAH1686207.1 2',3'-cyclic-nucleotide 2'-phosphodiesterase (5'-nucleotidase family) [Chelatococcus asaccharovorans]